MPSISKFLSVTQASFAQPSQYTVEIGPTKVDVNGGLNPEDKIMLNCNTVNIPQMSLNYADGPWIQQPHKRLYGEVTMTFQISEDFAELKYFDKWLRQVGWSGHGHFAYHNNYVRNILIRNYSRDNKINLTTTIIDAFPTTIDAISLAHASGSSTMPLAVKCGYWYHKHEYGDTENTGEPTSVTSKNLKAVNGNETVEEFRNRQGFIIDPRNQLKKTFPPFDITNQ